MESFELKLIEFIKHNKIQCENFHFKNSCHSVQEAAKVANIQVEDLVKNVCFIGPNKELIVAIVSGTKRASITRIEKLLNLTGIHTATVSEVLKLTGYPAGGVPSFGYPATYIIDEQVMEKEIVYSGGGCEKSLVKVSPKEMQKQNKALIARIRK